jgi:lipopolysaccharide transport system permease protein
MTVRTTEITDSPSEDALSRDTAAREDASRARPRRTIRPPSGLVPLNLAEVWEYRDLLLSFASREIKLRYRQTVLGVAWVLFQPLLAAGIFTFVFSRIAGLSADGTPYFLFAFAGQLAWMSFANTLSKTSGSLVQNAPLIAKVFFPRLVLPLSMLLATVVDFLVGLAVLLVLLPIYGVALTPALLLLPVWFLLLQLLSLGVGLVAGALMVSYRDVQYILPVVLQLLMYATPVAWPLVELSRRLEGAAESLYLLLNPLAPLMEAFRWSLFGTGTPPWSAVGTATFISLGTFAVGVYVFRNMERRFADVI